MQKEIGNSINSPLAKRVRQAEFALLSTGIVALSFIFAKGIKDSELEDTGIKFASASNSRQIEKKESQISSSSEFTQLPTVEKIEKMYEFMTTSQNPYLRVDAINFKTQELSTNANFDDPSLVKFKNLQPYFINDVFGVWRILNYPKDTEAFWLISLDSPARAGSPEEMAVFYAKSTYVLQKAQRWQNVYEDNPDLRTLIEMEAWEFTLNNIYKPLKSEGKINSKFLDELWLKYVLDKASVDFSNRWKQTVLNIYSSN
ncbi:MAG TPA: hypothetical protein VIK81_04895 [Patescibacteria group bacterium]